MNKKNIISFGVSTGPYSKFVNEIIDRGLRHESASICVANVHMCIEAWRDQTFAEVVNNSEIVTPDGMPLAKALQLLYGISQDRVAGMDLMPDLMEAAGVRGASIFLYGSTPEVLKRISVKIANNYPNLKMAGMISPPFRPLSTEEEQADIETINKSGANLILIALGCPKQERWMAQHKGKIKAVMIGVGGAFPVFAGLQKRAPQWMCDTSLEWLYRLIQEPRRLFKRYFITNSLFILLLAREFLKKWVGTIDKG